jgi:hypothetical protein
MSTVIKLKYSTVTAQPADDALQVSEPAYSFLNGGKLFIGSDQSGTIVPQVIGGKYFTDMLDHTLGTLTPSSAIIVDENSKIDQLLVDNISIDDKAITVTELNGDLTLSANGTGSIVLSSAVVLGSSLSLGNLLISANDISAKNTNGDVTLTPDGTGLVKVLTDQGLLIASGTEGTRPSAAAVPAGVIRYNTTSNRFEGTVNGNWAGLGGVVDVDQDTYITAEESTDEDILRLYTAGTERLTVSGAGVVVADGLGFTANGGVTVDNTSIDGDTININGSTIQGTGTVSSGTIILDPAPAAGDNGGDLIIRGNLQVTGTTTTVNSTVVEIADPVIVLGEDSSVDSLDRGVSIKYNDGSAKTAFFGWDRGVDNAFTFIDNGVTANAKFNNIALDGSITTVDGSTPSNGQILIGTGSDLQLGNLTAGDSLTITNGSGSIELDVDPAIAVATTDIDDTGDGVVDYTPAVDNAASRGAATFAAEQFSVNSGHVVITIIDGGTF